MSNGWVKSKYVILFYNRATPNSVFEYWAGTDYAPALAEAKKQTELRPDEHIELVEIAERTVWSGAKPLTPAT